MARCTFLIALAALATASVDAHNYVLKPLTEFKSGTPGYGNWVNEFSPPWSGDVSTGAKFTALAKQNDVESVRSFLESRGPDCGYSNPNAKAKQVPSDGKVTLYRSMDHPGPCELWLDNTMVYHNDDCKAAFGGATPGISVSFASCKGSCLLRFYWLGLQDGGKRMQSYKNCIPLTGGGGGGSDTRSANTNNSNTNNNGGGNANISNASGNTSTNGGTTSANSGGDTNTNTNNGGNNGGASANANNFGGNNFGGNFGNNNNNARSGGNSNNLRSRSMDEFTFADLNSDRLSESSTIDATHQ